ncbi:MAG TPA: hypothetical protein VGG28_33685 [Kofleriaceae bacterium]|jgi:hypothetical protein
MSGWRAFALVFACATSCTKTNPDASCANGTCSNPAFPYCDFDGSIGGTAGECVAVTCSPGDVKECSGSAALTCNDAGDGYDLDSCALGCTNNGSAHCAYLQPTYMPDVCDSRAAGSSITFTGSGTLDPNLDSNCTGGVLMQAGANDICVVRYNSISVVAGSTLTILGAAGSGRALALVADDTLTVDGFVDVGAHTGLNGPGGGTFISGALPGGAPGVIYGGGGAGGASAGGAGGAHNGSNDSGGQDGGAMNGGQPTMNPASLAVLVGGASSPVPVNDDPPGTTIASIGGGGGALEVVSCHGVVTVSGMINAGGGGGSGGIDPLIPIGGFGGGAGGNVLIEGVGVSITGSVFANGGGGGAGACYENQTAMPGDNGADGSLSDSVAAAGGTSCGPAGSGGFAGAPAGAGGFSNGNGSGVYAPGGGGGSVGFLQTYTPAGVTPTLTPAHVSPAFQASGTVLTR